LLNKDFKINMTKTKTAFSLLKMLMRPSIIDGEKGRYLVLEDEDKESALTGFQGMSDGSAGEVRLYMRLLLTLQFFLEKREVENRCSLFRRWLQSR
jgi:hypothetical protein